MPASQDRSAGQALQDSVIPGQYIIVLNSEAQEVGWAAEQLVTKYGLEKRRTYRHALRGFSATVPEGRLEALQRHPLVQAVVPNTRLFADLDGPLSLTVGAAPPADDVPVTGLRVRLVADELGAAVADGGEVDVWLNGGKRPTFHAGGSGLFNGHAHVGFNEGGDDDEHLQVSGVGAHTSATLIAVFAQEDVGYHNYGIAALYGSSSDRTAFLTRHYKVGADPLSVWDPTNGMRNSSFVVKKAGVPHIGVWRVEAGVATDFQVDGVGEGSVPMAGGIHTPFDRYLVGMPEPVSGARFDGQVAELLLWDRALSDCERDDVVSKLGARYGISVPVTGGPCIPPAPPSGLTAVTSGFNGIDLSWLDGSIDEQGFVVERRLGTEGDEAFGQIAQVGADVESYADGGLASDTEYCYRVAAFNANGTSAYSNTACDTTEPELAGQPGARL
jgi:hypothetical protein